MSVELLTKIITSNYIRGLTDTTIREAKRTTNKNPTNAVTAAQNSGTKPTAGNNREPPLQEFTITTKRQPEDRTREAIRYKKSEISVLTFPADLQQKNMPHVLFKIFPTITGAVEAKDTSQSGGSITQGSGQIGDALLNAAGAVSQEGGNLVDAIAATSNYGRAVVDVGTYSTNKIKEGLSNLDESSAAATVGGTSLIQDLRKSFNQFSLNRNADQLSAAIALFMPDGINTNYSQSYDELSLTSALGGAGLFIQALSSKNGSSSTRDAFIMEGAAALASNFTQKASDLSNALVFATTGKAINPQLEMMYKSPNLRTFTFDFRFIPRNASEAGMIVAILNMFKYHSSPEIPQGTTGRYFIPPSRFEIEFYNDQSDSTNPYLFKTKQCVLTDMSIDYSPNGYSSFYDGAPVETRVQLQFKETVILNNMDVSNGY